jgi:hypothetical protein
VRYADITAAMQLVQGEEEKERVRFLVNELAQQTMRGRMSAHWFLPLDRISLARIDAVLDDSAEKLYVSAFPYEAPRPSVANYFTVELTELKTMTQELADLFDLTLPVKQGQNQLSSG